MVAIINTNPDTDTIHNLNGMRSQLKHAIKEPIKK